MEDVWLIRRIKEGDTQAFDELVHKYYQNIFAYCYRCCGSRELAEDLTQDIFVKLITAIYEYKLTGKFSNYLFTIAVNTCTDYFRRKRPEVGDEELADIADEGRTPEEAAVVQEDQDRLQVYLRALPEVQRQAVVLHYYQNLKVKDIAAVTGVPVGTVKSRLKQGLDKLRQHYKQEDGHNEA